MMGRYGVGCAAESDQTPDRTARPVAVLIHDDNRLPSDLLHEHLGPQARLAVQNESLQLSATTLQRPAATRPSPDPARVQIQREHELNRALEVVRALQARPEMSGDRAEDVRYFRQLRNDLAREIHELHPPPADDVLVDAPPCATSSGFSSAAVRKSSSEACADGD